MMAGIADYHMHTPLCHHAEGHPREYVEAAAKCGLREIGFACHSPMPDDDFDDWRMSRDDLPRYVDLVSEAAERGNELGIPVRLGLEIDYLPQAEAWIAELAAMAPWDYLIGSVHYLTNTLVVDHPDHLSQVRDTFSAQEVWERYWELYTRAIQTGAFDFMAHPDLPKKFGFIPEGDLAHFYEPTIDALQTTDTAFEINTAGLRKPIGQLYPEDAFLKMAHQAGIPLVISSDAHAPGEVGMNFNEAIAAAHRAGFEEVARFQRRTRRLEPLSQATDPRD